MEDQNSMYPNTEVTKKPINLKNIIDIKVNVQNILNEFKNDISNTIDSYSRTINSYVNDSKISLNKLEDGRTPALFTDNYDKNKGTIKEKIDDFEDRLKKIEDAYE